MRIGSWLVVGLVAVLCAAACGDEDAVADSPDGFMVGDDREMGADMAGPQDQGGPDQGPGDDMPIEPDDMPSTPDMRPDMAPDMPPEPDMPAPNTLEAALVQAPWVGIFPIAEAVGEGVVGGAAGLDFAADGTVALHGEGTRRGKWQVLQDGSVYLFDLVPTEPGEFNQLILDVNRRGGAVTSLEVRGARGEIVFEQHALRSARDFTVSDLVGRWQALQGGRDEQGNLVYLAMRVDADGTFEYGATAGGNFVAFLTAPGSTLLLADRRSFWYFVPPINRPDTVALSGQLLRTSADEIRLFVPYEYTSPQGVKSLLSVELRKVSAFRP
jgi:hypothetical protein